MKYIFRFLLVLILGFVFNTVVAKAWYSDNLLNEIQIQNVDETGRRELSNTLLAIYDVDGNEVVRWTTGGTTDNVMLKEGTYYLKELDVPVGYKLQKEDVPFTVTNSNGPVILANELATFAIPKTGSVDSIIFLSAGLVLLTCLILLFYNDYAKKEN